MSDQVLPEPTAHHEGRAHHPALAHHFETLEQQREAGELGMWLFLSTEFMFFGGLFMAYFTYRYWYPEGFAEASHATNVIIGTANTAVLLTSSFTMALAVQAAQLARRRQAIWLILGTIVLGAIFLGVKGYEYYHKYAEDLIPFAGFPFRFAGEQIEHGARAYLNLYFLMTGLHAFHMIIGIVMLGIVAYRISKGRYLAECSTTVHNAGLYWHFVDLVWVYLFPFFYLVAVRGGITLGH